ncbi:MAG: STAS domain-containing protein [Planctomycetota bacterium]
MADGEQASIVKVEDVNGVSVARIYCPNVAERESRVIEDEIIAAASSPSKIVLDFSKVTMLPSVGLGMLIKLSTGCKKSGGKLAMFGLNDNLMNLLKISNLDKLLVVTQDEAKALSKVK